MKMEGFRSAEVPESPRSQHWSGASIHVIYYHVTVDEMSEFVI